MSAMTAPIGRRRTSAAICSDVGRQSPGRASGGVGGSAARAGGDRRWEGSPWRRGLGVQSGGVADYPGFERLGTEQAAGDAREEQGDVTGAERGRIDPERGGELPAVVDEPADEAEEAAGTAGFGICSGLGG